ncbi:hypothetical protein IRB23SM22_05750 [Alkalibacterium sp. s-m-22]
MNREAINYVKDAEARVEELRANAEKEIKDIKDGTALRKDKITEQTEHELAAFKKELQEQVESRLEEDEKVFEEQINEDINRFNGTYESEKDRLASRIAEEVLRRYGNS